MTPSALTIQELTVAYNQRPVLWRINAVIPQGVMMAIAGPNGAGKSTLIKTIVQIIKPVAGSIMLFEKPAHTMLSHVAYIPQRVSIDWTFPCTVFDVVLMGTYQSLGWFTRPGAKERTRALNALETVGMREYADTPIGMLSGGQQQRTFLARALVQQADIYLLDEPFVGIDAPTEVLLLSLMQSLQHQGKTIIVVHHDLHTISTHFDWLMLLNTHCIAYGQRDTTFTQHHLVQAYGPQIEASFMPSSSKSLEFS